MKKSFSRCVALAWAVASASSGMPIALAQADRTMAMPPAAEVLALKTILHTRIDRAQPVSLKVPAGQVVQLRMTSDNAHLDLRDAQGHHLRRLAENGRGVQTVMWRTQDAQQEQLWVTPAQVGQPATVGLELLQTWVSNGPAPLTANDTPMGPRLQALQQALVHGESTDAFWQAVKQQGTPLVEPWAQGQLLVTFLWRDQSNTNVRLFGSPSGNHSPLRKLTGSDVWWTSVVMDPRARLSYGLAPDVPQIADAKQQRRMILSTLQRDPLNPARFPVSPWGGQDDIYQGRSVLTLPQAPEQPWVAARAGVPRGTLQRHVLHSHLLGNERDVWTYVPAGAAPQALLVLFDAHAYVHDVPTPRILDNLVADGLLPPMAAVIVGNASPEARGDELPPHPLFARFIAEELMPWVKAQGLGQLARHTVVAGSSYGGLAASYLGFTHPEWFGHVLSMSGSYWWAPPGEAQGWMQRTWQTLPSPLPHVRFYIDAGRYESGRGGKDGILETSAELADVLRARGLWVMQRNFVGGHDYVQWQASLGCGLVGLLAPQHMQLSRMQGCKGVAPATHPSAAR